MTVASSGARSLQIPATGVVGSIADQQESPWWEGRTWEGEAEVCGNALHDTRGYRWLAETLRERGCALKTFQTIPVGMSFGLPLDVLHADAVQSGDCPPSTTRTSR